MEREGAETRQAAGSVRALETLSVTPSCALFLKASHRHWGFVFTTVFNPEQHVPSGFCAAPPAVTNGRQSAMLATRLVQSAAAGAGADCAAEERESSTAIAKKVSAIFGIGERWEKLGFAELEF